MWRHADTAFVGQHSKQQQISNAYCSWQLPALLRMLTKHHVAAALSVKLNAAPTRSIHSCSSSRSTGIGMCKSCVVTEINLIVCHKPANLYPMCGLQIRTNQGLDAFKCPGTNPSAKEVGMWCNTKIEPQHNDPFRSLVDGMSRENKTFV